MAFRLLDHANGISDPRRQSVVEMYARATDLLGALTFVPEPSGVYRFERQETLPSAGWRQLNQGFDESTGVTKPVAELCYELGGDLDIDIAHVRNDSGQKRAMLEEMQVTAIAQTFDYAFIKGDGAEGVTFDGLQTRAGTDGVNVEDINGTLTLRKLDEYIGYTRNATHLMMTQKMRNALTAASRSSTVSGNINFMKDDFGRPVTTYNDLPILIADPNGHGQKPIDNAETADGGGDPTTSIYILSLGLGGIFGIQRDAPDIRDLNELQTKPSYRSRVDWSVGVVVSRPDSFFRLRRINPDDLITA